MIIMGTLEKRDFIHSHLHQIDEEFINEVYQKMQAKIENDNPVVGYSAFGAPITKKHLLADLKEAESEIERGDFVTIEELEEEAKNW